MSDAAPLLDHPLDGHGFAVMAGVSEEKLADLERFRAMLESVNSHTNMVGRSTLGYFWSRHALDSAQLMGFAPEARVWADIGAGAGFPGLVLAILLKDAPGAQIHLIESMAKRCRFLQTVVDDLRLPAQVHNARAENLDLKVDIVSARACAPFSRLFGYAYPMMKRGARGLFLKGQDVDAELAEAARTWRFDAKQHPSLSDPRGRVVEVGGLTRARKT